jgi:oligopeptide transport system substrate-binding protein
MGRLHRRGFLGAVPASLTRRRFVGAAAASLAVAGRDAGAATSAPTAGGNPAGTLRRARGGNLTSLDPHRPISAADMEIAADLFVGLTAIDARGAVVPGCAARWSVSADGLRYEFMLRPGLRWSDGEPLTAADFVASYRRLLTPSTGALLGYRYDAIRGARALRGGSGRAESLGVSAPEPTRVIVELERPDTDFPKLAAVAYVVPTHVVARLGRDWAKPPRSS